MAKLFDNPFALIALILLIVLLFGAKRLPDVARSVGSSMKIFKKEVKDLRDDNEKGDSAGTKPSAASSSQDTEQATEPVAGTTSSAGADASPQSDPKNT